VEELPTRSRLLFVASLILVAVSAVFGGASRENPLRLALVEGVSLLLLAPALLALRAEGRRPPLAALVLLAAVIAIPALQLLPLPPDLWTRLPGRGPQAAILAAAGAPLGSRPLSLAPAQTLEALLALTPPAAMFLASLRLGRSQALALIGLWGAFALVGLVLGGAQLAAFDSSAAYLYATTNYGSLVGLFANRNHEAAFLLALLPLAAGVLVSVRAADGAGRVARMGAGALMVAAIIGVGVVRSRAGVLLATPALLGAAAVLWRGRRAGEAALLRWLAAACAAALLAVALFGLTPIAHRFERAAPSEFRLEAWPDLARVAHSYLPLGAGIGAFDRAWRAAEPLAMVGPTYFNHAHNDFLELWLEAGWPAALALAAFLAWFAWVAARAWRADGDRAALARGASVAIALILAHSAVDYPLRTETMAILFAFCCGLLASQRRDLRSLR
jgi:O-antigen ligase